MDVQTTIDEIEAIEIRDAHIRAGRQAYILDGSWGSYEIRSWW